VSKFLARAQAGDELLMVDDQIGAPTWTRDVADALVALSALRPAGILHLAADGYATRFDVAREILNATGLTGKQLRPCKTADFAAPAARPLNSRFDCTRVDSLLKEPRPHWRDSLHAFLRCGHDNVT
jgi:dTDP-4-dehydrorhamnose reductase